MLFEGLSTVDVTLFPDGLGQTLELPLSPLSFSGLQPWAGHTQFLLTLALETPALNPCFPESAPGTPDFPKSKSAPLLGSATQAPLRGTAC